MQPSIPISQPSGKMAGALRLVSASVSKEWRLYLRYPVDTLMLTLRPLLMFLPFYLMSAYLVKPDTTQSSMFGIYGFGWYSLVSVFFWTALQNVVIAGSSFIYMEVVQGTLESLLVAPTSQASIISANAVFAMGEQSILLLIGYGALAVLTAPAPSLAAWALALLLTLGGLGVAYGLGLVLGGVTLVTKRMDYTFMVVSVLAFLAGPSYSPAVYPLPLRVLAYANPLTYPIDLLRSELLGARPLMDVKVEMIVLAAVTVLSVLAGRWVIARAVGRLRATGRAGVF